MMHLAKFILAALLVVGAVAAPADTPASALASVENAVPTGLSSGDQNLSGDHAKPPHPSKAPHPSHPHHAHPRPPRGSKPGHPHSAKHAHPSHHPHFESGVAAPDDTSPA